MADVINTHVSTLHPHIKTATLTTGTIATLTVSTALTVPAAITMANTVTITQKEGVPTNGTSGDGAGTAGKGSLLIDRTNGVLYINTGTTASPAWTKVGTQS